MPRGQFGLVQNKKRIRDISPKKKNVLRKGKREEIKILERED